MFDVGFTELMLIGVMGLVILGPERLPVAARTIGKWVGKAKRTVGGVQREIQEELRLEEIRSKSQANSEAIKARMAELREETEIMEAPVVAADSVEANKADAESTVETEQVANTETQNDAVESTAEDDDPYGAQPFSEPTSLSAMQAATGTPKDSAGSKQS
ncbi:MAG TPA: twin-arginine translocase subunit TatB [Oceanospirillaceae bacterium]|nr:twin-arginine translocase subunit TatB [Oceanospirillaceae bacterium]